MRLMGFLSIAILVSLQPLFAQPPNDRQREYLNFIKAQATQLRSADKPPATREEWDARRGDLREKLQQAFGPFPEKACPLQPKVLGVLQRDGYRVEKIIFQTMPGVWMTASAYVPDKPGKHPALLAVHGHWRGARLDPVLQKRCIGPAKLGYFVLAVDAFGAGERGLTKNLGEYHGEMVAATLLPTDMTLAGVQVYENMRAVDYLLHFPTKSEDQATWGCSLIAPRFRRIGGLRWLRRNRAFRLTARSGRRVQTTTTQARASERTYEQDFAAIVPTHRSHG